jgi:hypothetical protein
LILRPDDLWTALVTQFSFYVNANVEQLRDRFVDFSSKRKLRLRTDGHLFANSFDEVSKGMVTQQFLKQMKNASLAEWLAPEYTTTTNSDRVISAIATMGQLQSYTAHYT